MTRTTTVRLFGQGWKGETVEVQAAAGMTAQQAKQLACQLYGAQKADLVEFGNVAAPAAQPAPPAPTNGQQELQQPEATYEPERDRTYTANAVNVVGGGAVAGLAFALILVGGAAVTTFEGLTGVNLGTPQPAVEQVAPERAPEAPVAPVWEPVRPVVTPEAVEPAPAPVPFFATEGIQEEPVEGLGQDW